MISGSFGGNTGQVGVPQVPAGLRRLRPFARLKSSGKVRPQPDFRRAEQNVAYVIKVRKLDRPAVQLALHLFGPGQPLDAAEYYIIIPDALGHGKSSKPSDGLKTKFPEYDYADMVDAQHRLLSEGLGIRHVRLIIGNSMGGMHVWLWGEKYPDYMDALVPMASQPTAMASRNWMLRRMMLETIRNGLRKQISVETRYHAIRCALHGCW